MAAVLKPDGGMHVVVGTEESIEEDRAAERGIAFVVPDYYVQEPVPWNDVPTVVNTALKYAIGTVVPQNPCGECHECCVTPYIDDPALKKPSHMICPNYDGEIGCKLQTRKPGACKSFECEWLKSQRRNDRWSEDLRPDRCGVFFTGPEPGQDRDVVNVHRSAWAPDALEMPKVAMHVSGLQAFGLKVRLVTHYRGEKR